VILTAHGLNHGFDPGERSAFRSILLSPVREKDETGEPVQSILYQRSLLNDARCHCVCSTAMTGAWRKTGLGASSL
jgi:hypothetical protein